VGRRDRRFPDEAAERVQRPVLRHLRDILAGRPDPRRRRHLGQRRDLGRREAATARKPAGRRRRLRRHRRLRPERPDAGHDERRRQSSALGRRYPEADRRPGPGVGRRRRHRRVLTGHKHVLADFGPTGVVWNVDPAAWEAQACRTAHRDLTRQSGATFSGSGGTASSARLARLQTVPELSSGADSELRIHV